MSSEQKQDTSDGSTIPLESFANPTQKWHEKNDPVMGGESHATVSITDGLAIFDGEVVDVPFLHAPGFVTMESTSAGVEYPDVSSCDTLRLVLRSSETYSGYRISFGNRHVPGNRFAFGYKANFDAPLGSDMGIVEIPFNNFTVRWDDATGDPIVTCQENPDFCPDVKTLQHMKTIKMWGEGVAGKVHLEIESIEAIGCSNNSALSDWTAGYASGGSDSPALLLIASMFAAFSLIGGLVGSVFTKRRGNDGYTNVASGDSTGVV